MGKQIDLPLGKYRHYKGGHYLVIGVAKHSETKEDLVVYVALYDNPDGHLWVRPLSMFMEKVNTNGKLIPRFEKVSD